MRVAVGAILGARLFFVLTHLDVYAEDPLRILAVWEGGLTFLGGVAGGVIASLFWLRGRGFRALQVMDSAAPGLAAGLTIGRIGDLVIGDHIGRPTDFALGWRCTGNYWAEATNSLAFSGPVPYPTGVTALPTQGCFDVAVHQTALYDFLAAGVVLLLRRTATSLLDAPVPCPGDTIPFTMLNIDSCDLPAESIGALDFDIAGNYLLDTDTGLVQVAFLPGSDELVTAGLDGSEIAYDARMVHPDGRSVLVSVHGEVILDDRHRVQPACADLGRDDGRGLADGAVVRVFNARGECLATLTIESGLRPGVAVMSTGAWYDPADGSERPLERRIVQPIRLRIEPASRCETEAEPMHVIFHRTIAQRVWTG